MALFTPSEMVIIAIISGIVSIIAILIKGLLDAIISKKQLQDKYHAKIFDKKFEAYTKLSSSMVYCAEIQTKPNEEKIEHLNELHHLLKEFIADNYLILEDEVIESFFSYAKAILSTLKKLEKGSDFSDEDKDMIIIKQTIFTDTLRKSLNLKKISKPLYS